MNLLLLAQADFIAPDGARLHGGDDRFRHLCTVLDAVPGTTLRAGVLGGLMGTAVVTHRDADRIDLETRFDRPPPPKLPLTLVLALPRPKMMRRILRTVAEMGVARLVLINTWRVEKSYWSSPALAAPQIHRHFCEGLEQARDTVLPQLRFARLFKPFVEDELPTLIAGTRALVAHPGAGTRCPLALDEPCTLAIGPEGGFTPYEVDKLEAAGMTGVHIGERVLRVDTAVAALVARLYS